LSWQFEREAKSFCGELDPIYQCSECRGSLCFKTQATTPRAGALHDLRNLVRGDLRVLDGVQNGFFVIEDLPRRDSYNSLDLCRRQAPTAVSLVRIALDELARDIVAITPRALHRVARRQMLAVLVEQFGGERAWRGLGRA
jgi:hypothetical protein